MALMALDDDDALDAVSDIDESDLSIRPRDFTEMVVAPTDWTISVLADLLKRKKIDLQPNYQRRVAWTEDKMSKFIESLFLRLPVPQIVLAELTPGRFAVIDGKQRLNSLARFCLDTDQPLVLKGCEYRRDLDGLTYGAMLGRLDLEGSVDAFQSHTVRTTVIKSGASKELLYLLFLRLNQNSVTLSPQELRRALYPGDFVEWLDEVTTQSEGMKYIFKKTPDFRMRDMEIATRFLAFYFISASYNGNMKQFLDNITKYFTDNWADSGGMLTNAWKNLEMSVDATVKIFGPDAFKVWNGDNFSLTRNRAVMDIMMFYFSEERTASQAVQRKEDVKAQFQLLCEGHQAFLRSLTLSTKTQLSTNDRFAIWGAELAEMLGPVRHFPSNLIPM
ncbi:hypothetical protein X730_09455 [Mesorhizobium sp. L103C565B0]|nr:hypothetical protein X730_09455 [Mesorhizobium sp. L103C565B0]